MSTERLLRTDAGKIIGTDLVPEATEFTARVRMAIKVALVAKIVADRLADQADEIQGEFFDLLRQGVEVAGVECWDEPSKILPVWEEEPDDLLEEVLSARAADEFGVLVQLMASDLDGETIMHGSDLAPSEREIAIAQTALSQAVKPPVEI